MSKLIINKHQICYIPEYNLYLQRVGVDNTSVRHTCERICSIYQICRDGNHGCANNGEQDACKIICYRIYLEPIEWK